MGDGVKFGLWLFKMPCPRPSPCSSAQHRINNAMSWKVILYSALWIAVRRSSCWLSYIRKPSGTYHLMWPRANSKLSSAESCVLSIPVQHLCNIRETRNIVLPIDKYIWKIVKSCQNGNVKSFFISDNDFLKTKYMITFWVPIYLSFMRLVKNSTLQTSNFVYNTYMTFTDDHF